MVLDHAQHPTSTTGPAAGPADRAATIAPTHIDRGSAAGESGPPTDDNHHHVRARDLLAFPDTSPNRAHEPHR